MNVTVYAYRRSGFDLIGQIRNSGIGGEVLKYANYADMISKGIEGSIGGDIVREKNGVGNRKLLLGIIRAELPI